MQLYKEMRIAGDGIFSMVRNQSGWYYMHCFDNRLGPGGIGERFYTIAPYVLNNIKQ